LNGSILKLFKTTCFNMFIVHYTTKTTCNTYIEPHDSSADVRP